MPRGQFGVPPLSRDVVSYADFKYNMVPTVDAPRAPTSLDINYPVQTLWRQSNPLDPSDFCEYILLGFDSTGALWRLFVCTDGNATALFFETDSGAPFVEPNALGVTQILGGAGIDVTGNGPGNTVTISLTGGGAAIDQIGVDFSSGTGINPVLPDGSGQISVFGNNVPNGTNTNAPVATHSRAVNQFHVDVQLATALSSAPGDPFDAGLSSYDTIYHTITGNGFVSLQERLLQEPAGTTLNLGISYSSPTFTISGSDGTALSATNPAWVVVPDNSTKGLKKVFAITNNYTFDDDSGTSVLTGNTFGTTAGVSWGQNMPFWLYFVINDANDAVTPMIARYPDAFRADGTIGKPSSSIADSELSFWAIDDGITVGDYNSNPCVAVGSFVMQKNDGANDDWTVQAITQRYGIGRMNYGTAYNFSILQNGATARYMSSSNGGDTLPTFNTDGYGYGFLPGGFVYIAYSTTNVNNTPSGTGALRLHLPFACRDNSWKRGVSGFAFSDASISLQPVTGNIFVDSNPASFLTVRSYETFGTAATLLTPGTLANGDGNFSWNLIYRGFNA